MVCLESVTLQPGFQAPEFELPEPLTGNTIKLSNFTEGSTATVIMFICNHCPFVVHLKRAIVELAKEYQEKGVSFIAVSSNSVKSHPEDGPDMMASDAKRYGYTFPYLYDESQDVARAYNTACTPEFLVFDKDLKLTYHGRFDDSSPGRGTAITGKDIRTALNATLAGQAVAQPWRPSIGCSIKWESGGGRW